MKTVNNIYKCTPDQTKKYVIHCMKCGLVPFIQSSPGIGKSSIVKQIAKEYNLKLIDLRLSTCDPTDLTGLPHFEEGRAVFSPFDIFPVSNDDIPKNKDGWLLFLDEFNSANKAVQAASYKLILDRMVGNYKLHDNCFIVAAGNLGTDKAIVNNLSTAMQSRVIHIEMDVNFNDWYKNIAIPKNYDSRIIGFLNMYNNKLMDFDPEHEDKTFCCPRTWEFVNNIIKDEKNLDPLLNLLVGTISTGVAIEFVQWAKIYDHLIKLEDIIKDPENCNLPDDLNIRWATISMLLDKFDNNNITNILKYVKRFDVSFRILFYRSILIKEPSIKNNPNIINDFAELSQYIFGDDNE